MLDFMLVASPISAVAVFVFLALASIGTVAAATSLVSRSLPAKLLQAVERIDERSNETENEMRRLRGDWATTIEQMETLEAVIEKKRKSAAASASRARAREEEQHQEAQPANPEDMLRALRAQVYGGGGGHFGGRQ